MSSRKDDPVFNVKFVQLVESNPCLWNSTLPEYSKKEEIQKAWQEVANETKDTVRNCRERWRTIRSSFLRSLKLSRTSTGRGKRKYYLSKYLQFLIPFTKTRPKNSSTIIAQRKAAAAGNIPPLTRISNMHIVSSDDTKDSSNSTEIAAIAEADVMVSLQEGSIVGAVPIAHHTPLPMPLNLQAIKQEEEDVTIVNINTNVTPMDHLVQTLDSQRHSNTSTSGCLSSNNNTINSNNNNNNTIGNNNKNTTMNNNINVTTNNCTSSMNAASTNIINGSNISNNNKNNTPESTGHTTETRSSNEVYLTEFVEWIKSKNEHQRHCLMTTSPDADQSFLNSLLPYLKEMSGKQNRRFRQKVVALVDAILDNKD